ncbi:PP2C family protein-serine/threonine phosphatase [Paenibacillus turpanensis]|uniref:PP2C family protein-serine/threonine phosphatase n=1 Tax=Paenibacillus turpanensis TaxID=2689078 RepID=UPI00140D1D01|nr:protein phosphatase 2C domain-containing protein [Paenibacillus turpanensis]
MDWLQEGLPYGIVAGLAVLFGVLLFVRHRLQIQLNRPRIRIGNGQTIGRREEQDDYFATAHRSGTTLAVLGDGISGMSNGRLASTVAVTTFVQTFQELGEGQEIGAYLHRAARSGNTEILRRLNGAKGGTTLIAAVIRDGLLYWGSVGDSILTVLRGNTFIPINKKHTFGSVLEERVLSGEITKEEAVHNPLKNRLVNFMGHEGFKGIEIGDEPFRLEPKDRVILCSDGVYHALSEVELEDIFKRNRSPQKAAEAIIEAVELKSRPNQDNATIIILDKGW